MRVTICGPAVLHCVRSVDKNQITCSAVLIYHLLLFQALIGIIALDTAGILFRWQLFDHAAHLGGVLFGM